MTAGRSRGVIVLGMHRSGTSAVTELVQALGFHAGQDAELKDKTPQNPRGFFERRDIRAVCNAMLQSAGAEWWKILGFSLKDIPAEVLADQREALRRIVALLDAQGRWVIKEPRLCVLLPMFLEAIREPKIVFVYRSPLEVAQSLRRRNSIPLDIGLVLWEFYNRAALANSRGADRFMLGYHDLLAAPAKVTARLAEWLARPDDPIAADLAAAAEVIEKPLQRERASEKELAGRLTPGQAALWQALKAGRGDSQTGLSERSADLLREFEADETRRQEAETKLLVASRNLADLRAELKAQKDRNNKLRIRMRELEDAGESPKVVEAPLPPPDDQNASPAELGLRARLADLERVAADRQREIARLIESAEAAAADSLAAETGIAELRAALAARDEKIGMLGDLAAHREAYLADGSALADARKRIGDLEHRLAAIGADRSRPGRLRALFGGRRDPADAPSDTNGGGSGRRPRGGTNGVDAPPAVGRSRKALGRVAFFTAVTGGAAPPPDPTIIDAGADYFVFTDGDAPQSAVWRKRPIDFHHSDPLRTARYVKLHPHVYLAGYDRAIWVEPGLLISALAEDFVPADTEERDIIAVPHPERNCVYEEAKALLNGDGDGNADIETHVAALRAAHYPSRNGLIDGGVILFRLGRPGVVALLDDWWRLVDNGSSHDILSFHPTLRDHPDVTVAYLEGRPVDLNAARGG